MSGSILIQGAMEVETDYLISRLEAPSEITAGGFRFWRGGCRGQTLVVSRSEIGTIYAACSTTVGIQTFTPDLVINQGIAGSHREDLHVGDVVVGRSCIHIHNLITPKRRRGEGMDPQSWELHDPYEGTEPLVFPSDPVWVERFLSASYAGGRKISGRLGSGDVFNREYDRILWLRERTDVLCEDMESIAVFQVCHRFGIPCVGLRILSNNELTGEPYQREVGRLLQRFIWDVLEKYGEEE